MSWIAGLAGKAEELLNKVDQTAAFTLGKNGEGADHPTAAFDGNYSERDILQELTPSNERQIKASNSASNVYNMGSGIEPTSHNVSRRISDSPNYVGLGAIRGRTPHAAPSSKKAEEDLFRFLNSSPETKRKSNTHSRQSSSASNKTTDSGLHFTARSETPAPLENLLPDSGALSECSDAAVLHTDAEQTEDPAAASDTNSTQQLSALQLENNLLRSEVTSLNQEMSSVIRRAKKVEEELAASRQHLLAVDERMSGSDQSIREFRNRESDAQEALRAKDSQVAVLRVRLEECERELASWRHRTEELESERSRILKDHTDSSGVHGHAVDSLKVKLAETESTLSKERDAHRASQKELTERLMKLERDQQSLAETVIQLQKKVAEERARADDSVQQLRSARLALETSRQELGEYKDKAARILQSKDRLLATMREGADGSSVAAPSVAAAEIDELRQERTALREEVQQCRATIESLRMELQDMDMQRQSDSEAARNDLQILEGKYGAECIKVKDTDAELEAKGLDCRIAQEELISVRTALQRQIQERDADIERLRNQLVSKRLSTTSEAELEGRLHALTESLIQKQTLVESLSTERSSLRLQLERLQQQCHAMEAVAQGAVARTQSGRRGGPFDADVDEEGARLRALPSFMTESPGDTEVMRKLKRSANTVDKFSIRLGLFLRRYPIARVFVIAYMMLLHFWVMIVLLTYQPEMHSEESKLPNSVQ